MPRSSKAPQAQGRVRRAAALRRAAPTNFLLTNPAALKRAVRDRGRQRAPRRSQLPPRRRRERRLAAPGRPRSFTLGENIAATPGKVVFRNELIEVIQYKPQTDEVFEIPLLVCPPWINRYYIADLAPGKSLVEWAVQHGHTVFAISYRNPDESMRDLTFDDYLRLGPLTAIDVARAIAGSDTVNTLAICLGGTMNAMALAYLDACGDHLVQLVDAAQLRRSTTRAPGCWPTCSPTPTRSKVWPPHGEDRLPRGQGHGAHVRPAARQRPRVPLRRRQLADR